MGPFYLSRPSQPTPLPCPHGPASQPLPCPHGPARPISLFTPRAHGPKIIPRADRWAKPASALAHTTCHCRATPTCQRISSTPCVFRVTDVRGLGHCSSPKRVTTAGRQLQPPYPGAIGQLACARPVIRSPRTLRISSAPHPRPWKRPEGITTEAPSCGTEENRRHKTSSINP